MHRMPWVLALCWRAGAPSFYAWSTASLLETPLWSAGLVLALLDELWPPHPHHIQAQGTGTSASCIPD